MYIRNVRYTYDLFKLFGFTFRIEDFDQHKTYLSLENTDFFGRAYSNGQKSYNSGKHIFGGRSQKESYWPPKTNHRETMRK